MKQFFSTQPLHTDAAALLMRFILGGLFFFVHGWQKIDNYQQILPMFGDIIGIGSKLSFHLVIFAEFFCGLFVLVSLLTRLTVIPIFITMAVAFFIAHAKDDFQTKNLPFVYLLLTILVFILGSGKYSVDYFLFSRKAKQL
ncbi:MAG: DoxX family protein [Chitinophagaceae bacterium]